MGSPAHRSPTPKPIPTVDRCICHDVPFSDILAWADGQDSPTLDDVGAEFGCGTSCGMCRPYLRRVLEEGVDRVPLMLDT